MHEGVSRRTALVGTALIGGLAATRAVGLEAHDPRLTAEGQVKMEACLDGHPAIWNYSGYIYAVQPDKRPRALVAVSGGSSVFADESSDGTWKLTGGTVTMFRDADSGAFLDSFANPFTGKTVEVHPIIVGGGGTKVLPPDGSSGYFVGRPRGNAGLGGFHEADPHLPLGRVHWDMLGDDIRLTTDHAFNVIVQPQIDARTLFAKSRDFFDRSLRRMPAKTANTILSPWPGWLDMKDVPGHIVWHISGEKLFDIAHLPQDYRARAGKSLDVLTARS